MICSALDVFPCSSGWRRCIHRRSSADWVASVRAVLHQQRVAELLIQLVGLCADLDVVCGSEQLLCRGCVADLSGLPRKVSMQRPYPTPAWSRGRTVIIGLFERRLKMPLVNSGEDTCVIPWLRMIVRYSPIQCGLVPGRRARGQFRSRPAGQGEPPAVTRIPLAERYERWH